MRSIRRWPYRGALVVLAGVLTGCGLGTSGSKITVHSTTVTRSPVAPSAVPLYLTQITMVSAHRGWATSRTHILTTHDGGKLWTAVTPPNAALDVRGRSIATSFISSTEAVIVLKSNAATRLQVFRTADGGKRWTTSSVKLNAHLASLEQGGSLSVQFVNPQQGWILLTSQGYAGSVLNALFQTTNGGQRWHLLQQSPTGSSYEAPPFEDVTHVTMTASGWGLASVNTVVFGRATILVTDNGGRSWVPQSLPLPNSATSSQVFVGAVGVAPPGSAWVAVSYGLASARQTQQGLVFYHTVNRGQRWTAMPWPGSAPIGMAQAWLPPQQQRFFLPNTQGTDVLRFEVTAKDGLGWHAIGNVPTPDITAVSLLPDGRGWAIGNMGDYQTINGGTTWIPFFPEMILR